MTVTELQQLEADMDAMETDMTTLTISFISIFVCP